MGAQVKSLWAGWRQIRDTGTGQAEPQHEPMDPPPPPPLYPNSLPRGPTVSLSQSLCRDCRDPGGELAQVLPLVPAPVWPWWDFGGAAGSTGISCGVLPCLTSPWGHGRGHPSATRPFGTGATTRVPCKGPPAVGRMRRRKVCCQSHRLRTRADALLFLPPPRMESRGYGLTISQLELLWSADCNYWQGFDRFFAHVNINLCLYFQYYPAITAFVRAFAMLRVSSVFLRLMPQLQDFANM